MTGEPCKHLAGNYEKELGLKISSYDSNDFKNYFYIGSSKDQLLKTVS